MGIRLLLLAAVGALALATAAPEAARAAPTPTPTTTPAPATAARATPGPMRAAAVVVGPSPERTPEPPAATKATGIPANDSARVSGLTTPPPQPLNGLTTPSPQPVGGLTAPPPQSGSGLTVLPAPQGPATESPPNPSPADAPASTCSPDDPASNPGPDFTEDAPPTVDWQEFVPTDTADHLATMERAARDSGCGVPWQLLAAIARVESDFGRNMATSSAGAIGYGQFLPSSWESYGNAGNIYDYRDALPAIATYLCQSGLELDPRAALFAYNHADWYVDMVLNLAVRYDRLAPGAPTPNVLDTGPAAESGAPLHYAPGRDTRVQTRSRTVAGKADWLGVPWRGRAPGASISPVALETTTLAMVRAVFGQTGEPPPPAENTGDGLTAYANLAWEAGLLATPVEPPLLLPAPDHLRPIQDAVGSLAEIRRTLERRRQPLVALVDAGSLPGHSPGEGTGDQPVVLIGTTPAGLVYSDPSFSSTLGYGLELSDADFLTAWQAATTPRQALALSVRPRPLAGDTHLRQPEPPPVAARVFATPVPPTPEVAPTPLAAPTAVLLVAPAAGEVAATRVPSTPDPNAAVAAAGEHLEREPVPRPSEDDRAWMVVLGAAAALGGALVIRRLRARRLA